MRRLYCSFLTLCLMLGCCIAASTVAGESASSPVPSTDSRQQLIDLEKKWAAAEAARDSDALRGILDDRFVATLGDKTYDKAAFIKLFAGDADPTAAQTFTYDTIIVDGDTAVLVATETAHGTRGGAAYTAVYRYTTTYIRRDGQWRALAEHIVRVPQAK